MKFKVNVKMVNSQASSLVFTTCRFNEFGQVLALNQHIERLSYAAKQIRCPPLDVELLSTCLSKSIKEHGSQEGLARLEWTNKGEINCQTRMIETFSPPLIAITHPAPEWPRRFRGIKHGFWTPYLEARESAISSGADIALLVHEHAIIDSDRSTPLILDENGLAFSPGVEQGGVESVTLSIVSEHLEKNGIPLRRAYLTEQMILRCKEMVVVGTGMGVLPIGEIDGVDIPLGSCLTDLLTDALNNAWDEI